MRKTTRRKVLGRGSTIQCLRSAQIHLQNAVDRVDKSGLPSDAIDCIKGALDSVQSAIQFYDIYGVRQKRIRTAMVRESDHIQKIIDQVNNLRITPEEKAAGKYKSKAEPVLEPESEPEPVLVEPEPEPEPEPQPEPQKTRTKRKANFQYKLKDGRGPFQTLQEAIQALGVKGPTHGRYERLGKKLKEEIIQIS